MQNRGILIQIYQMTKVLQGVLQLLCFPKPIVFFLEGAPWAHMEKKHGSHCLSRQPAHQ